WLPPAAARDRSRFHWSAGGRPPLGYPLLARASRSRHCRASAMSWKAGTSPWVTNVSMDSIRSASRSSSMIIHLLRHDYEKMRGEFADHAFQLYHAVPGDRANPVAWTNVVHHMPEPDPLADDLERLFLPFQIFPRHEQIMGTDG